MSSILIEISDLIGITGVILLLIGYFMLNSGRWIAMSLIYQIFNFLGSFLILLSLFVHWNLSAAVIEVCWMAISVMGMYRCMKNRSSPN